MSEQEVNIILAVLLDGKTPLAKGEHPNYQSLYKDKDGLYYSLPELMYTTDWNDFHRVWMKFRNEHGDTFNKVGIKILYYPTPLQAATSLAEVIKTQNP